jgi:hypothetical protein
LTPLHSQVVQLGLHIEKKRNLEATMSDNPRQKGKTQKHFFCFFFLLLSENNVFWETETWDSSQNHIHE